MTVFLVSFTQKRRIPAKQIDPIFDKLGDWIRINSTTWFLDTSRTSEGIYRAIRPIMSEDDNLVIAPVSPSQVNGWGPSWVWEWFKDRAGFLFVR